MCSGCGKFWTALQIVWSTIYVVCGAAQLTSGIFFVISISAFYLGCNIAAGSWNVIMGIVGGMMVCFGQLSPRRQETLIYIAVSILTTNCISLIIDEWYFYFGDNVGDVLANHPHRMFIDYARFVTRLATAIVVFISFLDSQFAFCSMHTVPDTEGKKKLPGSHEQVSDIEYIIPRPKPTSKPSHTTYDAYAQSWVFEADTTAAGTTHRPTNSDYLKVSDNSTSPPPSASASASTNTVTVRSRDATPIVRVDDVSDDNSTSDRKLDHMKSFSRSASPVVSASSSHISLERGSSAPPIYDCLEPAVQKVQYASLMKELQKAIVGKKEENELPSSSSDDSPSARNSDAEFTKELEAALQLIQDLESPNTPSEAPIPEKDSSPIGIVVESTPAMMTPTTTKTMTMSPQPAPPTMIGNGKVIVVRRPDSQSTSGYSSPTANDWSTTSSLTGSSNDLGVTQPLACTITNAPTATVISLYAPATAPKARSVTRVNIAAPASSPPSAKDGGAEKGTATRWTVRSLLRAKKRRILPRLRPELEAAIVKSESLAYLSEGELLARHRRNEAMQREIEERVIQQLGVPRTESQC